MVHFRTKVSRGMMIQHLYERSFRGVQVSEERVVEHLSSVKLPQVSSRLDTRINTHSHITVILNITTKHILVLSDHMKDDVMKAVNSQDSVLQSVVVRHEQRQREDLVQVVG